MHTSRTRAGAAVLAAALGAGLMTGAASAASPLAAADARATVPEALGGGAVVTLITGDRVHLNARGRVTRIAHGKGREHIRVVTQTVGGSTYVIPDDAWNLIVRGTLDRRLFNVTELVTSGYDDAHRASLPLIVSYAGMSAARARSAVTATPASVRRTLPTIDGAALDAPKHAATDIWAALTEPAATGRSAGATARTTAPGIAHVWLDGRRKAALDTSVPQIGAPAAWEAGYTGKGVKIAVLDTGVDSSHPDLTGRIVAQKNFSEARDTVDRVGHGTHVASIAAGSGAKSGGRYKGVAPGATIISAKVLDDDGWGEDSGIIAAMQWAADQGAKVANLSLGGPDSPGDDPVEQAVNSISRWTGMLFVVAAGNEGPGKGTIGSPGSAAAALTVGAVDRKDKIAPFSSRGPAADGSLKPDLTAPGVDIVAAKAARGVIGSPAASGYVSLSGTSMATPHVAGAAAILAQEHPDWTGARIKQALTASAKPTAGLDAYAQGTGRTDVARAVRQTVVTEQTSVGFGLQKWPHADDKVISRTVTYRNTGAAPVTLDLSLTATGPKGGAAPAGMFAVAVPATPDPGTPDPGTPDPEIPEPGTPEPGTPEPGTPDPGTPDPEIPEPGNPEPETSEPGSADSRIAGSRITVPAGGTTEVTLTADTRLGTLDGVFSGALVASSEDGQVVRTSFAAEREVESYDLTLKHLDTQGKGTEPVFSTVYAAGTGRVLYPDVPPSGTVSLRLPKGEYFLSADLYVRKSGGGSGFSTLVQPKLLLTAKSTVTFDARKAKPVKITAPASAKLREASLVYHADGPLGGYTGGYAVSSGMSIDVAQVGPATTAKKFEAYTGGLWVKGSTHYNLLYKRTGSLWTGFTHKTAAGELARVNVRVGASVKKKRASVLPVWESATASLDSETPVFAVPGGATEYVTTPAGVKWRFGASQYSASGYEEWYGIGGAAAYQAKKTYSRTLNTGVFGPKVSGMDSGVHSWADAALMCVSMFTDGSGGLGASQVSKARTVVTVGGKKVYDQPAAPCDVVESLGLGTKKVAISTDVSRSTAVAAVSTRVTSAWTVTTALADNGRFVTMPLSTVTFHPKLTTAGTAKKGGKLTVPLAIQGPAAGKGLRALAVQVSYDGGKTWKKTTVAKDKAGKRSLTLTHPKSATSVSFRTSLTDTKGNTFASTVIKAYLLK
ncbi:S8 family serine peptidase [Streptomyces sp. NPDC051569]|uniref:S8 family serine peptidase n=1 Tax=Streptomyces sp. NPDC051569 TaxID=3365661 RepID=UPI0037971FB4